MFEIIDNKGVISSGSEEEVMEVWDSIQSGEYSGTTLEGSVKLVKVIDVA